MVEHGVAGAAQPYHAAAGADASEAFRIVLAAAESSTRLAHAALCGLIRNLQDLGHGVGGCGLLLASGRPLPALDKILASHPLIHTAEGELFRDALRLASEKCGLSVIAVKERDLFAEAARLLNIPAQQLETKVAGMGKAIGPPWRQDEKYAALAAWLVLSHQ